MKSSTDARDELAFEIGRVHRAWRARLDEQMRHTGLTHARWLALLHLSLGGAGMTQRALAERLGVEGPTIVRLLDALQREGLIERRPVEGDRRAHHVHLTPAARPVLREIDAIATSLRHSLLAGIPADDVKTCTALLRRIGERLEKRV